MPKLTLFSACFGDYEMGNDVCDGTPGAEGDEGAPCKHRQRCSALVCHMSETGEDADKFLSYEATPDGEFSSPRDPKLIDKLDEQIERYGISDGVVTIDPLKRKGSDDPLPGYAIRARLNNLAKANKKRLRIAAIKRKKARAATMALAYELSDGVLGNPIVASDRAPSMGELYTRANFPKDTSNGQRFDVMMLASPKPILVFRLVPSSQDVGLFKLCFVHNADEINSAAGKEIAKSSKERGICSRTVWLEAEEVFDVMKSLVHLLEPDILRQATSVDCTSNR